MREEFASHIWRERKQKTEMGEKLGDDVAGKAKVKLYMTERK
jgi:hypothetical protein